MIIKSPMTELKKFRHWGFGQIPGLAYRLIRLWIKLLGSRLQLWVREIIISARPMDILVVTSTTMLPFNQKAVQVNETVSSC